MFVAYTGLASGQKAKRVVLKGVSAASPQEFQQYLGKLVTGVRCTSVTYTIDHTVAVFDNAIGKFVRTLSVSEALLSAISDASSLCNIIFSMDYMLYNCFTYLDYMKYVYSCCDLITGVSMRQMCGQFI